MGMLKRQQLEMIPYLNYSVTLEGCVTDAQEVIDALTAWLHARYQPDFDSDICVELERSAGLHDPRFPAVAREE